MTLEIYIDNLALGHIPPMGVLDANLLLSACKCHIELGKAK